MRIYNEIGMYKLFQDKFSNKHKWSWFIGVSKVGHENNDGIWSWNRYITFYDKTFGG